MSEPPPKLLRAEPYIVPNLSLDEQQALVDKYMQFKAEEEYVKGLVQSVHTMQVKELEARLAGLKRHLPTPAASSAPVQIWGKAPRAKATVKAEPAVAPQQVFDTAGFLTSSAQYLEPFACTTISKGTGQNSSRYLPQLGYCHKQSGKTFSVLEVMRVCVCV
jgi:hypothetical protein